MPWWVKSFFAGCAVSVAGIAISFVIGYLLDSLGWQLPSIVLLSALAVVLAFGSLPTRPSPRPPKGFDEPGRHAGVAHMAWQVAYRSGSGERGARRESPDLLVAAIPPTLIVLMLGLYFTGVL